MTQTTTGPPVAAGPDTPGPAPSYDLCRLGPRLLLLTVALVVAGVASTLLATEMPGLPLVDRVHRVLALEEQRNLPAFAAVVMSLVAAGLAAVAARGTRARAGRWWSWPWWLLAAVMSGLAVEEFLQVHDALNIYVVDVIAAPQAWTGPLGLTVGALAAVIAVSLLPFVVRLPGRTRTWLFAATALFATGAVGGELAAAVVFERTGGPGLAYALVSAGEEALEMLAVVAVVHAVVLQLRHLGGGGPIQLRLR